MVKKRISLINQSEEHHKVSKEILWRLKAVIYIDMNLSLILWNVVLLMGESS